MAFQIAIKSDAEEQLRALSVREQRIVESAIASRLVHQPTTESKAVRKLRPNPLASHELRAGDLRVLYNVDGNLVTLVLVGRKVGNSLIVQGVAFHGHQDHPLQPPGNGPA